jgi:hypothetical protein
VNTGGNTANKNIGDTSIHTGTAAVNNALGVQANSNQTAINGGTANATGGDSSLVNTGNHVQFTAGDSNSTVIGVSNSNNAMATQMANSNVNTGDNKANQNIGDTSITSGAAGVSNVFGLDVNKNATAISGFNAGNGNDSDLSVVNTGNHLDVNGGNTNSYVLGVSNTNNAYLMQMSNNCVNTGGNTANKNIGLDGVGAVMSGNAGVSNVFSATANGNTTGINGANLFNSGSDMIDLTNTGNHVTVNGGNSNTTNVAVSNSNGLFSTQMSNSYVTTGDNTANSNIGLNGAGTSIYSGNAALMAAFLASANANWTSIM